MNGSRLAISNEQIVTHYVEVSPPIYGQLRLRVFKFHTLVVATLFADCPTATEDCSLDEGRIVIAVPQSYQIHT